MLRRISEALRPGGIAYISYKYGIGEREDNGRYYNDYTENDIPQLFSKESGLECIKYWIAGDSRPDIVNQWLTCLVKKI